MTKTIGQGVDFLGWTLFPDYRTIRASTKRRAFKRIKKSSDLLSLQSYLGLLGHGNTYKVRQELLNDYWLWSEKVDLNCPLLTAAKFWYPIRRYE
ncbi:TPA: hypothetical protein DEA21_00515 [Candidatus Uhrbacteria bacterium]|nr:hypothetical protein [Candidatus Uhrbacteria bacterium]HCU31686.1 hypothetical protein [Candidatus Uhrbacteria bacterium]